MLSVVIPTYNDAKNIALAIASANQIKYVNEIIIVDDCSTDSTELIIKDIRDNCRKIKYYRNSVNQGSGLTFLNGLEKVKNSYVIMLNSDDFFIPKAIEKLFEYTIKNDLDLGYGKMSIKKNSGIHTISTAFSDNLCGIFAHFPRNFRNNLAGFFSKF